MVTLLCNSISLQWRHNEHDGVSCHWCLDCMHSRLFRRRSKKTPKLRVSGLCEGNSPVTGEFPAQRANNAGKCFHVHEWFLRDAFESFRGTWWRHQMETFSALLALCAGNSPVPVNFPHKGQWRGALMFSLICAWINDWVNNRGAGDLRRHRTHYDVTVIYEVGDICLEVKLMGLTILGIYSLKGRRLTGIGIPL